MPNSIFTRALLITALLIGSHITGMAKASSSTAANMHTSQPKRDTCWSESLTIKLIRDQEEQTYTAPDLRQLSAERPTPFNIFAHKTAQAWVDLLANHRPCNTDAKSINAIRSSSLTFLYCPLFDAPSRCNASPNETGSTMAVLAETPWARIEDSAPDPIEMTGTFKWDIRQFLIDRQVIETAQAVSLPGALSKETFQLYLQDYVESILLASSAEARDKQLEEIKERIPADILWLFRNAWQTTRGPFENEVANAVDAFEEDILEYALSLGQHILDKALDESTSAVNITTAAQVPENIQTLLRTIDLRN
ncbi:MAG: hypothetical protein FH759_15560 [Sediminimonas qiaohouensis]|uniref:Secreted protein n=1 Tax=Sediminimonas qiaohouensis TaxID=552061 RepID=A0A7C9HQE4_9RHOB|nr:hypothetical protein [Sediminimonas qiaohouensis]MTJ06083.1 hypothetical protein [Sediminimonas qiaohouensis]